MDPNTVRDDSTDPLDVEISAIARALLSPSSVSQTLQMVVQLAIGSIEGCGEVGISKSIPDDEPLEATSAVKALEDLQGELAEGPGIDVLSGIDRVLSHDLGHDPRWPRFGPRAAAMGFRSALAFRLFSGSETYGALQLYAELPGEFNAVDRAQGVIIATLAGVAIDTAKAQARDELRIQALQGAMASRAIIGQAQGILMERELITADQAFALLKRASQRLNIKLRDVAQALVDTGQVAGDDPTGAAAAPAARGAVANASLRVTRDAPSPAGLDKLIRGER